MKVLLIVTKSETVLNFRRGLIEQLQHNEHTVAVIAHDDERKQEIQSLGIRFHCVQQDNRGLNPLSILRYSKQLKRVIKCECPDVVFTFQLKPNTFGVFAARSAKVKRIFAMVEGAGDVFINQSTKWKLIRFVVCRLYKKAFSFAEQVYFLNEDDKAEFTGRGSIKTERCRVIPGIGVDLNRFAQKPLKNTRTFLMVARMLKTKGVFEYCKCARLVKQKYPDAVFNYLGSEGNVKVSDIQEYIDDGSVNYLGTVKDVRPYLEECTLLLLLSSYREGMPMSIMEAEAVGRGIITSDGIGCKDTVVEGYNGFLVPRGDYEAMAQKCIFIIENPEEAIRMGKNSRKLAEERFDQETINRYLVEVLENG